MSKQCHTVTFLPEGKKVRVENLKTIFETIGEENPQAIELRFACGAEGICRKCKIRAFQKMGPMTPTEKGCLSEEEVRKGIRLGCQARVIQDTTAEIIYKMPFSIRLTDEPATDDLLINPQVEKRFMPGAASIARVMEAAEGSGLITTGAGGAGDHRPEQSFSGFFKGGVRDCTAVFIGQQLACLEEGDTTSEKFAAAVDLGTNTLVISLVDLNTGRKAAVVTDTNPQMELGLDYRSRVRSVDEDPMNLEIMSEEILLRVDILIAELCRAKEISAAHVYEIAVSGTSGMLHLFLRGMPGVLEQQACFGAGAQGAIPAGRLDIRSAEQARVVSLPVISAYVGADVTAGILATKLHRSRETLLLLDLGTELKAVLHHHGRILATSSPTGGPFECAGICFGMRPENGAVARVRLASGLKLEVIGNCLPRGICGSGLLELAAELRRSGILDERGRFSPSGSAPPELAAHVIRKQSEAAFLLYRDEGEFQTDVYVTQHDLFLLMQAKAGLSAMIINLLASGSVGCGELSSVIVSGAFGPLVDPGVFFELGLVPEALRGRLQMVGNTAKKGAQMVLLDRNVLAEAEKLVREVISIESPFAETNEDCLHFLPSW